MDDTERTETAYRSIRWPALISGAVCLAGISVSAYLTYAHYTSPKALACSDKGLVNCAKVTTSTYSKIAGVPVSDIGLGYFTVMAAFCSPWAWRSANRLVRASRVLAALAAVGMVIWLLYVELFRLDAICLYCSIVHASTLLLFITVAIGTATTSTPLESLIDEPQLNEDLSPNQRTSVPKQLADPHVQD